MPTNDNFPTIGIMGAGQLGRMTAYSALQMGLSVHMLTPHPTGSMEGVGQTTVADWTDPKILEAFAEPCSVITLENEWAPIDAMDHARPDDTALWPSPDTLQIIRHKGIQNDTLLAAGLPLPDYRRCETLEEARDAADRLEYPVVLKQYRRSYDGYGNAFAASEADLEDAWADLSSDDGLLVENKVAFTQELSALVARRPGGEHVVSPIAYTEQRDHRCHAVVVPADISPDLAREAREVAIAAVEAVDGVGINAVELFHDPVRGILVNEIAPRPHNTGHYSIEGAHTSQYENHLRAILDWPLGTPELRAPGAVMVNILGRRQGEPQPEVLTKALEIPGVSVHIYGKLEVRPNRKMGHVTATGTDRELIRERAERAAGLIQL
jgi:5-(carboxyamino)imidazole ribonucleotide synthase